MATAIVFEGDQVEEIDDWSDRIDRLGTKSLLWIDIADPGRDDPARLAGILGLEPETERRLGAEDEQPYLGDFGRYLHVTAFAPSRETLAPELVRVEVIVSKQWVVTVHEGPVEALDVFTTRASGSGDVGRLDGLEFVASMLEWVLESYFGAFAAIELELDEFDARAMEADFDTTPEAALAPLVTLRREIGRLRRMAVAHRPVLLALTRPEFEGVTDADHSERLGALRDQLEHAVDAARDSRDSVVLSFDVLVARTGHRTNEIVKVLTLASVLLLPGALLAGIMGMNFKLGFFEENLLFWVIVAAIALQVAATVVIARKRRWI